MRQKKQKERLTFHQISQLLWYNEKEILKNLRARYLTNHPYTYIGSHLISMNPFMTLSLPNIRNYVGKSFNFKQPHPFALAGEIILPPVIDPLFHHLLRLISFDCRIMLTTNLFEKFKKSI